MPGTPTQLAQASIGRTLLPCGPHCATGMTSTPPRQKCARDNLPGVRHGILPGSWRDFVGVIPAAVLRTWGTELLRTLDAGDHRGPRDEIRTPARWTLEVRLRHIGCRFPGGPGRPGIHLWKGTANEQHPPPSPHHGLGPSKIITGKSVVEAPSDAEGFLLCPTGGTGRAPRGPEAANPAASSCTRLPNLKVRPISSP